MLKYGIYYAIQVVSIVFGVSLLTFSFANELPVISQLSSEQFVAPNPPRKFTAHSLSQTQIALSYILRDGSQQTFTTKPNQYALLVQPDTVIPQAFTQQLVNQHQADMFIHKANGLHDAVVFSPKLGTDLHKLFNALRQQADNKIFISPLLQLSNSSADIAILPSILVHLADGVEISELQHVLPVRRVAPLLLTQREYELVLDHSVSDIETVLQWCRDLAKRDEVVWAEPLMHVTPQRMDIFPNDPLFLQQWHLHNTGQQNGLVDADIDAPQAWEISQGMNTVVAVIDDGIQVDHPDFKVWHNPGEQGAGRESNGIDDDGNGYIDDYRGWDFTDHDNDPSPAVSSEMHGTAVAGVAVAQGNNALGVVGSAPQAQLLPIRWGTDCREHADALRYAGKYADVINNSWGINGCQNAIDAAIEDIVMGRIVQAKRGDKGTPVLFAAGNSASGWMQFKVSVPAGEQTFRWVFLNDVSVHQGYNTVWLDDIQWPNGERMTFDQARLGSLPVGFNSSGDTAWRVVSDGIHVRGAQGQALQAGNITHSQRSVLSVTRNVQAGELSFWIWVSSEYQYDPLEFYVGGTRLLNYTSGQYGHDNVVGYPASNPNVIAIGASTDGATGQEERTAYSQFGENLDVVAPSSNQNQRITTTDRNGAGGYSSLDYTNTFGGTSAASPLVAGIVADILAFDRSLSAQQVRQVLHSSADKIGFYPYVEGRNDYYGYGRVNLLNALYSLDFDRDLLADSIDTDDDNDGLPDIWELEFGLNPRDASDALDDNDQDGLNNLAELVAKTNPFLADSDGDGMPDAEELALGRNPNNSADRTINDTALKVLPVVLDFLLH